MNPLPNSAIETLQEYVFAMAMYAVSIESLYDLQRKALKDKYLELDEMEQVETIAYEAKRLFHAIDGLVHLMGERAEIDAGSISKKIQKKIKGVSSEPEKV